MYGLRGGGTYLEAVAAAVRTATAERSRSASHLPGSPACEICQPATYTSHAAGGAAVPPPAPGHRLLAERAEQSRSLARDAVPLPFPVALVTADAEESITHRLSHLQHKAQSTEHSAQLAPFNNHQVRAWGTYSGRRDESIEGARPCIYSQREKLVPDSSAGAPALSHAMHAEAPLLRDSTQGQFNENRPALGCEGLEPAADAHDQDPYGPVVSIG